MSRAISRSIAITSLALALSACAPSLLIEAEHVSHPFAGWPFGPADEEAQITQGNALLRWRRGGWYVDVGVGVKLYEKTQRDFYGPNITGTVRVGHEFRMVAP